MARRAAIGFAIHTGWAAAVVVTGPTPAVLARHKLSLAADAHDARFVYHVAAEQLGAAAQIIEAAAATATKRASEFLNQLRHQLSDYELVIALPRSKRSLPPLATILQSHPTIHSAEGELYRQSIVEAARRAGLHVELPATGDPPHIGKLGPPWGKDQKDAAALAWAVLRT